MQRFVYPAIFFKDKDEDMYRVLFPDIELVTDGKFIEEAFLFAKEFLKQYFVQVLKYDLDFNYPTNFEQVKQNSKSTDIVMLVDATVQDKDLKKKS